MLPIPRTMILAVPSAMLAVLFMAPFASITASASPSPLPMPLTSDHSSLFVTTVQATRGDVGRREHKSVKPVAHYEVSSTAQRAVRYQATSSIISGHAASMTPAPKKAVHGHSGSLSTRARISTRDSTADLLVTLGLLTTHGNDVVSSSNNLKTLAAQSASTSGNNAAFQQQCASELTSFHTAFQSFSSVFGQLGADKGLANYDKNNQLETLLKDVVNANKNALSAVDVLVYNIPGLGPILGPIVYEIKCIIDEILNAVENITDGLLNSLQPLLTGLLGQATSSVCGSGLNVAGLCL